MCWLQLLYDRHFTKPECDFETANLYYKKTHYTVACVSTQLSYINHFG